MPHADGSVDVLVSGAGEIAAGEVDRADRCAQVVAVAVQAAEVEARGIRAARPFLAPPVALVVHDRALRLRAVVVREGFEDALLALLGAEFEDAVGMLVGDEADERSTLIVVVGVVVRLVRELVRAERGAAQTLFAPERTVVDGVHLDDETHREVLVQLLLPARHRRDERDAVVEHWRVGEDRETRSDRQVIRGGGHPAGP